MSRSIEQRELLARYLYVFERYDMTSLVELIRTDAVTRRHDIARHGAYRPTSAYPAA
jgi:hypothetical protein